MAQTRITYRLVYIENDRLQQKLDPVTNEPVVDEKGNPVYNEYREIVDHPDGSTLSVVNIDHAGGGSDKRYLAHVMIVEPL